MKILTLTVGDSGNVDIVGFCQSDTIQVNFNWTTIPAGLTVSSAALQVKVNKDDVSAVINLAGTVTADGTSGTASATFQLDLSSLTANQAYFDLISVANSDGFTKTWKGLVRVRQG